MKLQPLKSILAASKEKIDELMAGPREKIMKSKAEHEMAKLDMDIAQKQSEIEEMLANKENFKDFSFITLMEKLDKIALLERRKGQYEEVLSQLFPSEKAA